MKKYIIFISMFLLFACVSYAERGKTVITDPTGNYRANVDKVSGSLVIIDFAHHELHEGDHFFISSHTTLGSGDDIAFGVETPNSGKYAHMVFGFAGTGQLDFDVYETSTYSGGGSVTAFNSNRNSGKTSTLTISGDPVVTSSGTHIAAHSFGVTGSPVSTRGGQASRESEINLKQNTKYLFVFTSGSADNIVDYEANWYEHTSSN